MSVGWQRFWFESNQYFNWVEGPEDWEKVKAAYDKWSVDELLDKSREDDSPSRKQHGADPKFGLAVECRGERTLRAFFTENGMTP